MAFSLPVRLNLLSPFPVAVLNASIEVEPGFHFINCETDMALQN